MADLTSPKSRFTHLLCDLDGTLIDSGDLRVHAEFIGRFVPSLKHHQGWKAAWRVVKESQSILRMPSKVETNLDRMVGLFEKHFKLTRDQAINELRDTMGTVFPKLKDHFGQMQGASEFIEWAHSRYPITLATNPFWALELVKLRMIWGGIDPDKFKSITTADRMHAMKPTLEYYQEVLEQEGLKSEQALLIGNERKMDLPATKAGIAVFLIRLNAKEMTCIEEPTEKSPGAWRGNYHHLQKFLEHNSQFDLSHS